MSIASLGSSVNEDGGPTDCSGQGWLELGETSKHPIGVLGAGIAMPVQHGGLPQIGSGQNPNPGWQATQMLKRRAAVVGQLFASNSLRNKREMECHIWCLQNSSPRWWMPANPKSSCL